MDTMETGLLAIWTAWTRDRSQSSFMKDVGYSVSRVLAERGSQYSGNASLFARRCAQLFVSTSGNMRSDKISYAINQILDDLPRTQWSVEQVGPEWVSDCTNTCGPDVTYAVTHEGPDLDALPSQEKRLRSLLVADGSLW